MSRLTLLLVLTVGCAGTRSPLPDRALISEVISAPSVVPPAPITVLPLPPTAKTNPIPNQNILTLEEIFSNLSTTFPLILAIEQERVIANGGRLSAEGNFDTLLKARVSDQNGTFSNGRLDFSVDQPIMENGGSVFAGWRMGQGNFPIYYGDRKTADGGEFRAGFSLPILRDRPIDRRRVALRQAQILEQLADPFIQRTRLDISRAAAVAYWNWVAAGIQYRIASDLLNLARDRQDFVDERFKLGADPESVTVLNRRLTASRQESLLSAERTLQQAAIRLSLYYRTADGTAIVPAAERLPDTLLKLIPESPRSNQLEADIQIARQNRPEIIRFQLLKDRAATELALARNRTQPSLNFFAAASQDLGFSKKTFIGSGPFSTDRTNAEFGLSYELEAQRREALGRLRTAQGLLAQLTSQERFAFDEITAQVQDATSELIQTFKRLEQAREEYQQAIRVRDLETESFRRGRTSLIDLNLQEIATAEAQFKVAALAASYQRAINDYLITLGLDPAIQSTAKPNNQP